MLTRWVLLLPIVSLLSACAAVPTGPSVMVLPGVGKPFDQFQVDDMLCRQYAQAQTGAPPGEAGRQSAINTAALGTLLGAGAGAAIGAAAGDPGVGAAIGAGSGLLIGAASGAEAGAGTSRSLQWRYDVSYMQCMYAKGNQLPGTSVAPQSSYVPPPPGTPPPPSSEPLPPTTKPPPR
ncbi:MAG TPA: glycine zipper family protein [Alphaproteobacteria bacterium]|nr:glycine zipper family protein [Alphaproteobacteria bacterium]